MWDTNYSKRNKMKKIYFLFSIIGVIMLLVTSCEKDRILFDASSGVVGFSSKTLVVKENETGEFNIYLGGSTGITATEVTLEADVEGIGNPAMLGTDFNLSSTSVNVGLGEVTVTVTPVDNDVFTGDKTVRIKIASNSQGYNVSAESVITITISDDEHPLKTRDFELMRAHFESVERFNYGLVTPLAAAVAIVPVPGSIIGSSTGSSGSGSGGSSSLIRILIGIQSEVS